MNKIWIKAKICEVLSNRGRINYTELFAYLDPYLDPSCHKVVIEVLGQMYHDRHVRSNCGVVELVYGPDRSTRPVDLNLTHLCKMIALYVGVDWDVSVV